MESIARAIDGVDISIEPGEFVAVLGANGSGKSTLARHLNALLKPTEGTVWINGMDTRDEGKIWEIRRTAGMVFQNPDNQIIGQVVDEDVAFGPENLGVPAEELPGRVEESLKAAGIYEFRNSSPNNLSGGQKQRVSIAGVLAMHSSCIVLDEPTAMLDPLGRNDVIRAVRALNYVENITVILITHYMEETIYADRIYVMDGGKVAFSGTPREVYSRVEDLEKLRLTVPPVVRLSKFLRDSGLHIPADILTEDGLADAIAKEYNAGT